MKHFVLLTNQIKDADGTVAAKVRDALCAVSLEVTVTYIDGEESSPSFPEDTDCVIALGGDGTMLLAAQKVKDQMIPIIGVNLGTMGYLSEVELSSLSESAESLVHDQVQIENRMKLSGKDREGNAEEALNDVVLTRHGEMQLVGYRVSVNGKFLSDFYADGIIVSTPTGSTGYNLSAGGPIVEPSANLLVLTPVCPHTLNTRSIILSPQDVIAIEVLPSRGEKPVCVSVSYDGRSGKTLTSGDEIVVKMSDTVTKIVKIKDEGFLDILQNKMGSN